MKDKTKTIIGCIIGVIVSTIASCFASLYVFQTFILKGQQSSMGFEYIPVLFGTPVLAVITFVALFTCLSRFGMVTRLLLCVATPVMLTVAATVAFYKLVFNY
jgi:hypothetical protein